MKITLTQLCHHRWILPILSELHQQNGGSKFVTLINRLKLSRDSLSRTLQIMLELELISRNTVYAHPLRPEYILINQKLGEHAYNLIQQLEPNQETLLNKWALPTILALQTHHRFSKLLEVLPSITSRALTMTLKDLGQCGYIRHQQRQYVLTPTGELIANSVALLGGSRVIRNPI